MLFSELRDLRHEGDCYDADDLASAMTNALLGIEADHSDGAFSHSCPIRETPASCRVFLNSSFQDTYPFPGGSWTATQIAHDLTKRLVREARYPTEHEDGMVKGWAVHRATIRKDRAVVVFAAWVPK